MAHRRPFSARVSPPEVIDLTNASENTDSMAPSPATAAADHSKKVIPDHDLKADDSTVKTLELPQSEADLITQDRIELMRYKAALENAERQIVNQEQEIFALKDKEKATQREYTTRVTS
jgi:hypothetical protein